jgi:hypothetical protein
VRSLLCTLCLLYLLACLLAAPVLLPGRLLRLPHPNRHLHHARMAGGRRSTQRHGLPLQNRFDRHEHWGAEDVKPKSERSVRGGQRR